MVDRKYSRYIRVQLLVLIISLLTGFFVAKSINHRYESNLIEIKREMVANLVQAKVDTDILDIVALESLSRQEVDDILIANNLENVENYKGFTNLKTSKRDTFVSIISIVALINITLLMLSIGRYQSERKRMLEINLYLNKILNNDFSLDIQEFDDDMLAALKNDIYKITNKLRFMSEYSISEKKNLEKTLSDISHQLKTPLTSMFVINSILEDDLSEAVRSDFLKKNRQQLEKVDWLVKSLLKMSQIDSGTIAFNKEKVQVKDLVDKALSAHLILIELKHIELELDIDHALAVECDINWTSEALSNIINNAIEHTPSDGKISIVAKQSPLKTTISISDSGVGMNSEDLSHIFTRFYKKDKSSDGIGIGMNLSKSIMNRQNGDIKVESQINVGSTFKVIID